jgi:hypothetical protein
MNPYAPDLQENQSPEDQLPKGLSTASTIATILMLVFGLSGLMGIIGLLGNLVQLAGSNANVATQPPAAKSPQATEPQPPDDAQIAEDKSTPAQPANPTNPFANAAAFKPTALQIVIGIVDLLISIPMILWSIQVLQRKRPAAIKLSWLALGMALLTIPRGIVTYLFLPQLMDGIKGGMLEAQRQQPAGQNPSPDVDFDAIFQVISYVFVGCMGFILLINFLIYLFCYFQLRKPTTLARLSD